MYMLSRAAKIFIIFFYLKKLNVFKISWMFLLLFFRFEEEDGQPVEGGLELTQLAMQTARQ